MATETMPERVDFEMAAARLAAVYLVLCQLKFKLSRRIIPPLPKEIATQEPAAVLRQAIGRVYTDSPPNVNVALLHWRQYAEDYHAVMAEFRPAVAEATTDVLDQQFRKLVELDVALQTEGIAELMNLVTAGAKGRIGHFKLDVAAEMPVMGVPPELAEEYWAKKSADNRARVEAALTAQLREPVPQRLERLVPTVIKLFNVFSAHPRFLDVLEQFAGSPTLGLAFARSLVREAMKALSDFGVELNREPDHAWRYPAFALAAVDELGLMDIYAFPEFAVDLGEVYGNSPGETALMTVGVVIAFVGVFLAAATVPGVAVSVALTVAGVADLAVNGMQTAVAYLKAREQDAAAIGSTLSGQRLAERSDYVDVTLSGAAALLSAIALVFAGAKLVSSLAAREPGTLPLPWKMPKAARTPADATATQGASGLGARARRRLRDLGTTGSEGRRVGAPALDIGTSGVPDRPLAMAVGAIEEPVESASAIAKPTFDKATGPAESGLTPVASASEKAGAGAPSVATKSQTVVQGGSSTPKGAATSKGSKAAAGKVSPAKKVSSATAQIYSRRKTAESLILKNEADIWIIREDYRGLYIQSRLAKTEYKNYVEPLLRYKDQLDEWFPVVDFVAIDGKSSVSLKTYNPYTKRALDKAIDDLGLHAEELFDWAPGERVILDVRVPPATPSAARNNVLEAVRDLTGKGSRLQCVVKTYP